MEEVFRSKELAKRLGVSRRTIYHWRQKRGLKAKKIGNNGIVVFREKDVIDFLEKHSEGTHIGNTVNEMINAVKGSGSRDPDEK